MIEVYADGAPPGALISAFSADLENIPTGEVLLGSYPIFQWIAPIDMQTVTDCWLKVASTNLGNTFYWLNSPSGTGTASSYQGSTNVGNHEPLAVCLEAGAGGGIGDWLTLDWYSGTNPGFGFVENVPTNFNASGTQPGEVYTADLVFTSDPNVGTTTIF